MQKEIVERLCLLLKSADPEMCRLAITMFTGLTKDYNDYYQVRMCYDNKDQLEIKEPRARNAFNEMFNSLDEKTIKVYGNRTKRDHRRTSLSSSQRRRLRKGKFKSQARATEKANSKKDRSSNRKNF